MFSRCIQRRDMKITSPIADSVFPNIVGDSFENDATFLATMRVLLGRRIPNTKRISFYYSSSSIPSYRALTYTSDDVYVKTIRINPDPDAIFLHALTSSDNTSNERMLSLVEQRATEDGFSVNQDLMRFFAERFATIRVFTRESTKTTLIYHAGPMSIKVFHLIQTMFPRYAKWYFDPAQNTNLTQEEKVFLKSLASQHSSREYEEYVELVSKTYNFREVAVRNVVAGYKNKIMQAQLSNTQRELERMMERIQGMLREYHDLLDQKYHKEIFANGLMAKLNEPDENDELLQYFLTCDSLHPVKVRDKSIEFIVQSHIQNFSPDLYECARTNDNSYFFSGYNTSEFFRDKNRRRKLLDAIFSDDPVLKIKVCGVYFLEIGGYVQTNSGYHYPADHDDFMPNPHLHRFACLGGHESLINKCLDNNDLIGAVSQCQASVASVNLGEAITIQYMLEQQLFCTGAHNIIELPDGTSVTPSAAYEWLEKQSEVSNEQKEEAPNA